MIKQVINVNNYWRVIVYYDIDYNFFNDVALELRAVSTPVERIEDIYYHLRTTAKAITCSNLKLKTSVVAFNKHKDKYDYLNSIVHEAEHVKQAMLKAYNVNDEGEPPAYTIGFLVMKMLSKKILKTLKLNYF